MPDKPQKPPIIHDPREAQIFVTGGDVEAIDSETVRLIFWADMPSTNERRIVARLAAPISVALEMNAKMRLAISDTILGSEAGLDAPSTEKPEGASTNGAADRSKDKPYP
jgi:hypothetical protein